MIRSKNLDKHGSTETAYNYLFRNSHHPLWIGIIGRL